MTNRSGWCAPAFGLPHTHRQHVACRSAVCGCEDFGGHESLSTEGRKVLAMSARTCENGGTNQDGPGGSQRELQAVVPGPRRSVEGTD